MPYPLCPMPYAHEYLIFLRKAIQLLLRLFLFVSEFYQKELVESPKPERGEIKIRLFITPILFLLDRGRSGASLFCKGEAFRQTIY